MRIDRIISDIPLSLNKIYLILCNFVKLTASQHTVFQQQVLFLHSCVYHYK